MSAIDDLIMAVESRCPVSFHYALGDTPGVRSANPHAVFVRRLNSGEEKVYLDAWVTGGASSTGGLPYWRKFIVTGVSNVTMEPDGRPFPIAKRYNPASYEFPLAKV